MKRLAIIGLGRFGMDLVKELSAEGVEIIAIDRKPQLVNEVANIASVAVAFDATSKNALIEQGLREVDVAVVSIGEDFESNILTALLLKEIGVRNVIARAMTKTQAKILQHLGIDEIINPEEDAARRLAKRLSRPNLMDFVELAEHHVIVQMKAPQHFVGKSLINLDIRRRYNVNLVAIKRGKRGSKDIINVPHAEDVIEADDVLIVVGMDKNVDLMARQ